MDAGGALPILRTTGEVVGPGHNSVVRGPDNRQLWCVYHRWSPDTSARILAIDPLDWEGKRMRVAGPSTTPQPAPQLPTVAAFFEEPLVPRGGRGASARDGRRLRSCWEVSARALGEGAASASSGAGLLGRVGARRRPVPDGRRRFSGQGPGPPSARPEPRRPCANLSGFALTAGWEDLFEEEEMLRFLVGAPELRGDAT